MSNHHLVKHGPKLLAVAIASSASGLALAENAGRVSFVSGSVTAATPDGQSRTLSKGDVINGGDRISTGSGRIQLRFTDGGFVSLQPNTVFGVDQYLYANTKPEESSLFFNLVRGGMRTITGVIGHVNKANYRVKTPVATIGIRGTEYLANFNGETLQVSVGHGSVFVANGQGELTLVAGQSAQVLPNSAPRQTQDKPEVGAPAPEDDVQEQSEEASQDSKLAGNTTPVIGEQVNADGTPLVLGAPASVTLPDSGADGTPYYSMATLPVITAGEGTNEGPWTGVQATFDQGNDPATRGGLLTLRHDMAPARGDAVQQVDAGQPTGTQPLFDKGTLHYDGIATYGALSWGTFTNGTAALSRLGDGVNEDPNSALEAGEYIPYIIGKTSLSNLGHGKVYYTLQGGTYPRLNNGTQTGTLDRFSMAVDLDFATLDLSFQVTMPNAGQSSVYQVDGKHISLPGLQSAAGFSTSNNTPLVVTGSGGACGSGCSALVSGFFAGEGASQIGAAYQINDFLKGTISGVAGLGINGYEGSRAVLPNQPGYTAVSTHAGSTLHGGYYYPGDDSSLTGAFGADGGLQKATTSGGGVVLSQETAKATDIGTKKTLAWGRWYSNHATVNGQDMDLSQGATVHYIIGQETPFNAIYNMAGQSATYTMVGGTTPTSANGNGTVTSATLKVDFGFNPTLALDMNLSMADSRTYSVKDTFTIGGSQFQQYGLNTTGTNGACNSGCSTDVSGFFSGQQAERVGMGYTINDTIAGKVEGAAALERGGLTQTTPAQTTPAQTVAGS